jgi:hypothetical protein
MEDITALNLQTHGLTSDQRSWAERVDDLEALCRSQADLGEATACWQEIVHAALVKFNNDPKTIFDFCTRAQFAKATQECRYHSIGIIAAAKQFDLPPLKYMCGLVKETGFEKSCYEALVSSTLSTVLSFTPRVIEFCQSLAEEFKEGCFRQMGYNLAYANPSIRDHCQGAPQAYRSLCRGEGVSGGPAPRSD